MPYNINRMTIFEHINLLFAKDHGKFDMLPFFLCDKFTGDFQPIYRQVLFFSSFSTFTDEICKSGGVTLHPHPPPSVCLCVIVQLKASVWFSTTCIKRKYLCPFLFWLFKMLYYFYKLLYFFFFLFFFLAEVSFVFTPVAKLNFFFRSRSLANSTSIVDLSALFSFSFRTTLPWIKTFTFS